MIIMVHGLFLLSPSLVDKGWCNDDDVDMIFFSSPSCTYFLYLQHMACLVFSNRPPRSYVKAIIARALTDENVRFNLLIRQLLTYSFKHFSKTVAELKMRFPSLQNGLRNILSNEMEKVVREEKFLKEEPDRLESALRRCKKLTGTLVTLKRLLSYIWTF